MPTAEVAEVIRVTVLARVPQGPPALLGVANLRGSVLPVASLRAMLGCKPADHPSANAIVLDIGAPVAIAVDAVVALDSVSVGQIETPEKHLQTAGTTSMASILGAFSCGTAQRVARILDIRALLGAAFERRARAEGKPDHRVTPLRAAREIRSAGATEMLVTFEVAGQEFAVPLVAVREILPAPATISSVAHADAAVLGLTSVRDRLLPLLSCALFSVPSLPCDRRRKCCAQGGDSQWKVADSARSILAADKRLMDAVPPILAARTGGESRINSIYRGEGGDRLISVLAADKLFRDDVMQRLAPHTSGTASDSKDASSAGNEVVFLVFRLGDDEFGLPIDTVVEVAQCDESRGCPGAEVPEGVVNLRGEVLPSGQQTIDMPPSSRMAPPTLVVRTAHHMLA